MTKMPYEGLDLEQMKRSRAGAVAFGVGLLVFLVAFGIVCVSPLHDAIKQMMTSGSGIYFPKAVTAVSMIPAALVAAIAGLLTRFAMSKPGARS